MNILRNIIVFIVVSCCLFVPCVANAAPNNTVINHNETESSKVVKTVNSNKKAKSGLSELIVTISFCFILIAGGLSYLIGWYWPERSEFDRPIDYNPNHH